MIDPPDIPEGGKVIGVGIDQIEVSRIRDSLDQHGSSFLDKIFTPAEQAYCSAKANPAPHYAARFAAKEAVAKAFGTGFGKEFGWLDAEVTNGPAGEPIMGFSEKGQALLLKKGGSDALVSLTHLNEVASSIVILIQR